MLRFGNVATPATAAAVVVPDSVPPPALEPIVTFTLPAKPVATLPSASCAVTCTAGVIAAPAVAVVGCTLKTSTLGAPAVTLNAALVPPPIPAAPAVRVYPVPVLLMLNPENVAMPPAAATLDVPERAPPPGFAPIATVTEPLNAVAVLPCASCAVTWTAGVIVAPATVVVGWTVKTSWLAAPGVTLKTVLLAVVTDAVKLVTVLPNPSCAVTCTAGVIGAPAVTLVGCTVNTSLFAAAGLMIKEALVCPVSPVADVVSV